MKYPRRRFLQLAGAAASTAAAACAAPLIADETEKWAKVIKFASIKAE